MWVLYKDICNESYFNMFAVLRAYQLGLIQYDSIRNAVEAANSYKWNGSLDLPKIVRDVKTKLPRFGVNFKD